jgi:hypothetical protein
VNGVLSSSTADPQQVADAVLAIVETAAGKRELRYRVSTTSSGVDDINRVCAQVQSGVRNAFGLTVETTFTQRTAASAP